MSDPAIVPYVSYVDAKRAMAFLETAFGLETVQAFDGPDGRVMHGEMRFGTGVIMLGSVDAPSAGASPGIYLVVEDVDTHHAQAVAAGATIVYPPDDTEFGTRRYRARDPEGHEWSFGTYQPRPVAPDWGGQGD
ncbi:MAG: VOC family protein [Pseudomonadota bacterium]